MVSVLLIGVITFTGRLVNNKGVKELMLAFEKVAAKHNDAKLLIVGGQSFSNNVKDDYVIDLEFIASRIGNGVIFTGYVDYSEITSYLQLSTIVVVPSTSFEAFPLSILEAMAAGIPVVVSDAGGTLEVIDERSGIVVNRGEGLMMVYQRLLKTCALMTKNSTKCLLLQSEDQKSSPTRLCIIDLWIY